jgi:hypothetical protein
VFRRSSRELWTGPEGNEPEILLWGPSTVAITHEDLADAFRTVLELDDVQDLAELLEGVAAWCRRIAEKREDELVSTDRPRHFRA